MYILNIIIIFYFSLFLLKIVIKNNNCKSKKKKLRVLKTSFNELILFRPYLKKKSLKYYKLLTNQAYFYYPN